jgi:hypothetical protein
MRNRLVLITLLWFGSNIAYAGDLSNRGRFLRIPSRIRQSCLPGTRALMIRCASNPHAEALLTESHFWLHAKKGSDLQVRGAAKESHKDTAEDESWVGGRITVDGISFTFEDGTHGQVLASQYDLYSLPQDPILALEDALDDSLTGLIGRELGRQQPKVELLIGKTETARPSASIAWSIDSSFSSPLQFLRRRHVSGAMDRVAAAELVRDTGGFTVRGKVISGEALSEVFLRGTPHPRTDTDTNLQYASILDGPDTSIWLLNSIVGTLHISDGQSHIGFGVNTQGPVEFQDRVYQVVGRFPHWAGVRSKPSSTR